jgi:hypothetical protein
MKTMITFEEWWTAEQRRFRERPFTRTIRRFHGASAQCTYPGNCPVCRKLRPNEDRVIVTRDPTCP